MAPLVLPRDRLDDLLVALSGQGYRIVGPTVRDGAIVYDDVRRSSDLPIGWTEEQSPGRYRLKRRGDEAVFGFTVGPHSWKKLFHVPVQVLFEARRGGDGFTVSPTLPEAPRATALLGARSCELAAIAVQDKVLLEGPYGDPHYAMRRRDVLVVAVNCAEAGGTCFCASMGTGPNAGRAGHPFDLALTEILGPPHRFLLEIGSNAGEAIARSLGCDDADGATVAAAADVSDRTAASMGRRLETEGLAGILAGALESPRWDEVANRCLACANCTLVCPTCFCTTVEDVTDLEGSVATRSRRWDSCFTLDFSHVHGGSVRASTRSRYRQWLTHKLGTWHDQFGSSGCVGCGRCITWCPVGIDITEEAAAIRASSPKAEV
ncbi:MAG: 4Fe-4S dicluster domain-containing protein [Acidobacteriota bacterium]